MKRFLIAVAAFSLMPVAFADDHGDATDEVLELVEAMWEARNDNDYETQHDLMSDGMHYNANSNGTFFMAGEKPSLEDLAENLEGEYNIGVHAAKATMLADTVVLARYYLEGSISANGNSVSNYRTRVTHIWVKEDGEWKSKSWHFSPLHGGGTIPN